LEERVPEKVPGRKRLHGGKRTLEGLEEKRVSEGIGTRVKEAIT